MFCTCAVHFGGNLVQCLRSIVTWNVGRRTSSLLTLVARGSDWVSASRDPIPRPANVLHLFLWRSRSCTETHCSTEHSDVPMGFSSFKSWLSQRNERNATDQYPEDILLLLCEWLCIFASEAQNVDGSQYTPQSIVQNLAGLQRYIIDKKSTTVRLVDPKNSVFKPLHQLLDRLYCDLHAQGVVASRKQSESYPGLMKINSGKHVRLAPTLPRLCRLLWFTTMGWTSFYGVVKSIANWRYPNWSSAMYPTQMILKR